MNTRNRWDPLKRRDAAGNDYLLLGLWLRASFAGAMVAAAGLASRFGATDGLSVLTAITLIATGGTLAWLAWQRARSLLDRFDAEPPTAAGRDGAPRSPVVACATTSS